MNALCRIELLGGLRIRYAERSITRFRTRKAGALLAYLAYFHTQRHSRETLVQMLWPELTEDAGRNNLSTTLSSLRQQLTLPGVPAGSLLAGDRLSIGLHPAAIHTDVEDYESYLAKAEAAAGETERAQHLADAIAVYSGPLLPDYYEEWVETERRRLADAYLQAIRRLIRALVKSGEVARALEFADKAVRIDPLSEEAHRDLMRLYVAQGRPAAALRQYQELEQLLHRDLGANPSALTRQLVEQIQRADLAVMPQEMQSLTVVPSSGVNTPVEPTPSVMMHRPTPPDPYARGTVTLLLIAFEEPAAARRLPVNSDTAALTSYRASCRKIVRRHGGDIFQTGVDTIRAAFVGAAPALACAIALHRALARQAQPQTLDPLPAKIALHTGDVAVAAKDYAGPVLQQALRLLACGHNSQILCSEATVALLKPELEPGVRLTDLGIYRLHAESEPQRLFQVEYPEMPLRRFPPLKAEAGSTGTLPPQLTRFFGREAEIARLLALLTDGIQVFRSSGVQEKRASTLADEVQPEAERSSMESEYPNTRIPEHLNTRLVTLTGPGGVGKTRLAVETAGRLYAAFSGAVWFVHLADIADARLITDVLLQVLPLTRKITQDPLEQIVEMLSRQPALIIFDNFEHLVDTGAPFVKTLIGRLPSLTCLVTSRQCLGLAGEQEFVVPPLPVPEKAVGEKGRRGEGEKKPSNSVHLPPLSTSLDVSGGTNGFGSVSPSPLLSFPSIQLFLDRAQAVKSDFQITERNASAVAELCERLEGIPLAIELAAARASVLTPAQMLAQLVNRFNFLVSHRRDLPERHRTLRATIDWSFRLLEPPLQRFFARLSVFRGGWTLESAEVVCGTHDGVQEMPMPTLGSEVQPSAESHSSQSEYLNTRRPEYLTLDFLFRLREYSLIVAEEQGSEMRFRMLETLREYAEQQITEEERVAVARRHVDYFLAVAEAAEPNLVTAEQVTWLQRLEAEHDNLRAALAWCHSRADAAQTELRLAAVLWRFWLLHSHIDEGRQWLAGVLARPEINRRSREGGKVLYGAGYFAEHYGEFTVAHALIEESLAIRRELADERGIAGSLGELGRIYGWEGDHAEARALLEQSLTLWRRLGDPRSIAATLTNMANVHAGEEAKALLEESIALYRRSGDRHGVTIALHNLASILETEGEYARSRRLREEQLALCTELGDKAGIASASAIIGELALHQGDREASRLYLERSLSIRSERADRPGMAHSLLLLGDIAYETENAAQAHSLYTQSFDLARDPYTPWILDAVIRRLPRLAVSQGRMDQGARLAAAAQRLPETADWIFTPYERALLARSVVAARAALGETAFAAAWSAGQTMTLEQAVDYALLFLKFDGSPNSY